MEMETFRELRDVIPSRRSTKSEQGDMVLIEEEAVPRKGLEKIKKFSRAGIVDYFKSMHQMGYGISVQLYINSILYNCVLFLALTIAGIPVFFVYYYPFQRSVFPIPYELLEFVFFLSSGAFLVLYVAYVLLMHFRQDYVFMKLQKESLTSSDFSVIVRHLPHDVTAAEVTDFYSQFGWVESVSIPLNNGELLEAVKLKKKYSKTVR